MKPQENPCADTLNPNLKGRDICEAFADYQILLVADQFQTGFDQFIAKPRLHRLG